MCVCVCVCVCVCMRMYELVYCPGLSPPSSSALSLSSDTGKKRAWERNEILCSNCEMPVLRIGNPGNRMNGLCIVVMYSQGPGCPLAGQPEPAGLWVSGAYCSPGRARAPPSCPSGSDVAGCARLRFFACCSVAQSCSTL